LNHSTRRGAIGGWLDSPAGRLTEPLSAAFLGLLLVAVAALPSLLPSQVLLATVLLLGLLVLRAMRPTPETRLACLVLGLFLSLRYLFWRTTSTISYHDLVSFVTAIALYLAELYAIASHVLGMFVNVQPLKRDVVRPVGDPETWPSVDILIPTYNESVEILAVTVSAAIQVQYPSAKLRVYVCDDGGTQQKLSDRDTRKAEAAAQRAASLKKLCDRVGAHYLTRERNEAAKAGNLNSALSHVHGDLLLILDADHVPTTDILEHTVGLFQRDSELFLVQTPHFFVSPDPVERNLGLFERVPSETEMFYDGIQHGLDFWNASFFCGSAALLRRAHIDLVGGISGQSVVEDAETALELHSLGKRSAFVNRPMVAGLQPETCASFITQRVRWAQGMLQILIFKNPLRQKALSFAQKLCYFNSSFFWLFCFARLVFLVAPAMYLLFGCQVYDANGREFIAYAVPHVLASLVVSDFLYGKIRWPLVSTLYEVLQSVYCLKGIIEVLRSPRSPTFNVTPKGETTDQDVISPAATPFWVLYGVTLVALGMGVWRWFAYPEHLDVTAVTMAWELANLYLLHGTLGALYERRQIRQSHRMPANIRASLIVDGANVPCTIRDVSVGGARIEASARDLPVAELMVLRVPVRDRVEPLSCAVQVRHRAKPRGDVVSVGVAFTGADPNAVVALVHGDSGRWMAFRASRRPAAGFLSRAGLIFGASGRAGFRHHAAFSRRMASEAGALVTAGVRRVWKRAAAAYSASSLTPSSSPGGSSAGRPHPHVTQARSTPSAAPTAVG